MICQPFLACFTLQACIMIWSCLVGAVQGVPHHGWKMTDRFIGFRYELQLPAGDESSYEIKMAIRDLADDNFCFGWAQDSPRQSVVGEIRCNREAALKMKAFLSNLASEPTLPATNNETLTIRDYPDTLIRLHFSHFKLIDKERNTCFRDEPHKCSHLYDETVDGTKFRSR